MRILIHIIKTYFYEIFAESESLFEEKCRIKKDILIDDVDLRVESLKGDLDNLRDNFFFSIEELFKKFM